MVGSNGRFVLDGREPPPLPLRGLPVPAEHVPRFPLGYVIEIRDHVHGRVFPVRVAAVDRAQGTITFEPLRGWALLRWRVRDAAGRAWAWVRAKVGR